MTKDLFPEITGAVICCFYNVYNTLGSGFLENVYQKSLAVELDSRQIKFAQQSSIQVSYKKVPVGNYVCDLLVDDKIIVEIKAVKCLLPEHDAQLLNYLKATTFEIGLLLNFGPKPEVRRRIFTNDQK
jgi:GxxExxY protein